MMMMSLSNNKFSTRTCKDNAVVNAWKQSQVTTVMMEWGSQRPWRMYQDAELMQLAYQTLLCAWRHWYWLQLSFCTCLVYQVKSGMILLGDVRISTSQQKAAKSFKFPLDYKDQGIYAGNTSLDDKKAELHGEKLTLPVYPSQVKVMKRVVIPGGK